MFNLGPVEIFVVFALALVVLGPRRMPEVARQLGKFYGMIRRTTYELKHTLDQELLDEERSARKVESERRREEFRRKRLEGKEEPGQPIDPPRPMAPDDAPEPVAETSEPDGDEPDGVPTPEPAADGVDPEPVAAAVDPEKADDEPTEREAT
jgi:sec-independent protein translocase protein TatB